MKRDHKTISPTAFNHIIWRTLYGVPFADEFMAAAKKHCPSEYVFDKDILNKKTKHTTPKIAPLFEGRYKGGENALGNFIKRNPGCTILELAAGFSLHGANLAKKYPKIEYIETDLSEIIRMKEKIVKDTGLALANLSFKSANALDAAAIRKIMSRMKAGGKIAIYCEGLLSYFDDKEMRTIAEIVRSVLKKNAGAWITPDPALGSEAREALKKVWPEYKKLVKKAEKMAKQKYDDHGFKNEKQSDKLFQACGFHIRKMNWPTKLKSWQKAGYEKMREKKIAGILKKFGKTWVMTVPKL